MTTLFANVNGVDAAAKRVLLDDGGTVPYDTLVLATGARHAYFGHDEWEPFAPGLKTLEDATTLRRRILVAFERAERETDPERRAALLTFVIVGAGPTGVEMAGTIADLARDTLPPRFPQHRHPQGARGADRGGPARARGLSRRPLRLCAALAGKPRRRGDAGPAGHRMHAPTAWSMAASGWRPEPSSGRPACAPRAPPNGWARRADRACRVQVEPDLTVPGHPDIFAIGDTVTIAGPDGKPVPGIAPAAKQQGRYVAALIKARLRRPHSAAVPLQARRQPGADRQAARR